MPTIETNRSARLESPKQVTAWQTKDGYGSADPTSS
jgi:hypothetical protein